MPYYPIFLDLNNQNILVVGGGEVAERKIKTLLMYGCTIYISSPHLTPYLQHLVATNKIHRISHESLDTVMNDTFMVIAATDNAEANTNIASQAKKHNLLVNAVDQPKDCNFIMPSIVKRGNLQIAISTAGKSPALAKKIRKNLEHSFPPEYDSLTELLGTIRTKLLFQNQPSLKNKIIFQQLADSNLLEMITHKNWDGIRATLQSILGKDFPIEKTLTKVFKKIQ
ncbi:MAG: precorrin-2 dehydrogenase/sirohydrochlorin ferrochelatase family protein [Thermodesulfobacteriota bacterium]